MQDNRRKIPSIDKLLKNKQFQKYPSKLVKEVLETVTQRWRERLKPKDNLSDITTIEKVLIEEALYLLERGKQSFKKVINATGVVLNTNLGRAPLAQRVISNITDISCGYSNLEVDLDIGERSDRYALISPLLQKLTGAEDSLVVNNNAAAVFLILDTFAKDKEVIVSRGELIEIGGSFRLPDVLKKSGCKLVEVGTTNRTYIDDYERAISDDTALLLKTHTSNYRIVGFSHNVSTEEIAKLGKKYNILTVEDVGSGLIVNLMDKGLPYEPTVKGVVDSGINLVSFSGDKLLGGPQSGIIVGKKEFIDRMKKNPLMRTLRIGKHIIGILEQILRIYLYENPISTLPHLRMITESLSSVKEKAQKLCDGLARILDNRFKIRIEESATEIGGGSYPGVEIPTCVVSITSTKHTPDEIQKILRKCTPPIITRVVDDKVLLDARTIFEHELEEIINGVRDNLD